MPSKRQNLVLIGPMGAGKSTIGKRLAAVMRMEFVDVDQAIERQTGAAIPLIFDIEGEVGFRSRERAMITALAARDGQVIATGGGAVLDPANRASLKLAGTVVFLDCSVDQQFSRTRYSKHRPLLQTPDPVARLTALYAEREPLYRRTADIVINTDRRSVKSVVKELSHRLESGPESASPG